MNRSLEFSVRYHRLKESLQKVVEVEYAKATHAARTAEDALQAVRDRKEVARGAMSGVLNPAEWHLWNTYMTALETSERDHEVSRDAADREQQQAQKEVGVAFRESYKWRRVVDKLSAQATFELQRREQTTADERAVQRHREER